MTFQLTREHTPDLTTGLPPLENSGADELFARYVRGELGVKPTIRAEDEVANRVEFLIDYLQRSGATGLVLGISGGVDSTVAGKLAQIACTRLAAKTGKNITFTAMRLPYGVQADEDAAQAALEVIHPDHVVTVNIKAAADALHEDTTPDGGYDDPAQGDFVKGNIKARLRMTAQYAEAGRRGALVVGTDHAAEAVMGFFTKHGDGACDVAPLAGLTKSQVRELGRHLGASDRLVNKVPTADLEELRPGLPDETAYGVTYDEIDAYLTGEPVSAAAKQVIATAFVKTAHKRALPATP